MLSRRYQLLLLAAIVLAAYYPAVLADFSRIDDAQLAESYREIHNWTWWDEFIPFSGSGLYYRPLIGLSFLIDKYVLDLLPGLMHLENILFHLLNTALVYFLTFHVIPQRTRASSFLPLLAASLFGLHPINTESVNWISGRTDLLAGSFLLMSALFLLKYKELNGNRYRIASLITFLAGLLTKETAIAFLPGAFLLISASNQEEPGSTMNGETQGNILRHDIKLLLGGMAVVLLFIALRSLAFSSNATRIGMTLRFLSADWQEAIFVPLKALGFYLKKLIIPYPLNFAIMEVDPLYELLAVPCAVLCIYIASHRNLLAALFTTGIFLITPSFLLAFGQIAWTPYAERYLYIPSAFLIVSVVAYLPKWATEYNLAGKRIMILMLLGIMFASTLSRSLVWQNDIKLCKDTIDKSPQAKSIRLVFSGLLAERGEYAAALDQLEKGRAIPYLAYDERFDLNTAHIYFKQGRLEDAISISELALKRTGNKSIRALGYLIDLLEIKKQRSKNPSEINLLKRRIFSYNSALYKLNHDPHVLYDLGIAADALGEHARAASLFRQARNNMPDRDLFKLKAQFELQRIEKRMRHDHTDDF